MTQYLGDEKQHIRTTQYLGRRAMEDDLVPERLGRGPLIIDDEDDEGDKRSWEDVAESPQQHMGQRVEGRQAGASDG